MALVNRWNKHGCRKCNQAKASRLCQEFQEHRLRFFVGSPSLQQVIDLYLLVATVSRRTARNNVLSMLKILERVAGNKVSPKAVPLKMLTRSLAERFQEACVRDYQASALPDEPSQREAKDRALRSSRSTLNQARSLFACRDMDLMDRYAREGLVIPESVQDFMRCKVRGKLTKHDYNRPPDEVIERALTEIENLKDDIPVYLAFWCAAGIGLRRKEIFYLRWEHIVEVEGRAWVIGGFGKDGREIRVPIQQRAWDALKPFRQSDGWVISERSDRWARRLSRWMREQGWQTRKTLHELRAYIGSLIYAQNPVAAKQFLRHSSILITEKFYLRYSPQSKPLDVL